MMSQMGAPMPSIREFRATLPAAARSMYFRDEIGNISTSHARFGLANTEVELRPRYPLFGGWKVSLLVSFPLLTVERTVWPGGLDLGLLHLLLHIVHRGQGRAYSAPMPA